ncbi:peptidyl-prolyl cis-trans isomerase CYP95 isoform X2 [Vigna radiata var. radiata]|nr:peptidyl-prolyl cis-trans isomerase CYP95 isoform X2 [Vigna radiata var. radiata]XP_014519036.1 peptidyl-prolyl cis-trans isomerase CYP95 isoform X2 [Vigna radiata var. radiata]XP_014519037.1 peptidyl-prolyl cis-trans isomerase CYP95 isoform X2 [Vigna radiata var. radiata]
MIKKENSRVFMDVSIDGDPVKRMVFKLLYNVAPMTAENFRALCTGEKGISQNTGKPLHYKGSFFHQIIKGSIVKGGDFVNRNGTGGESIYGSEFPDESPVLKHDAPGLLSMAIANRDTLGSHFIITLKADHHLDGNHVVFGKLVHGRDVLRKIGEMGDEEGHPTVIIKIITCGEYSKDRKRVYKSKMGETNNYETRKKGKHKKSSKDRRKRKRYYSSEFGSSSDCDTESLRSEELWQMVSAMFEDQREESSEAYNQVRLAIGKNKKSSKERRKWRKYYSSESSEAEINKSKMGNNGFSEEINKPEMETDGFSAAHHGTLDKGKRLKYAEEDREWIEIFSESSSDYYNKVSADSDMSSSSGIYS